MEGVFIMVGEVQNLGFSSFVCWYCSSSGYTLELYMALRI